MVAPLLNVVNLLAANPLMIDTQCAKNGAPAVVIAFQIINHNLCPVRGYVLQSPDVHALIRKPLYCLPLLFQIGR
jgi:hypothetical protein